MLKSRPVSDLTGKDVQGAAESDTEADTTPIRDRARGRILLSIMESDWTISRAVVLLPKSYLVRAAYYETSGWQFISSLIVLIVAGGEGNGD